MVRVDQGTSFIHYFSTLENAGIAKITDPAAQTSLIAKVLSTNTFFDARLSGNGPLVNMLAIRFTELNEGTLFVYFYGDNKNICYVTNPTKVSSLITTLESFIGAGGGTPGDPVVEYARLIDSTVNDTVMYIGEALPGTLTTAPLWRIKRVSFINEDTTIVWAEGTASFDKIWDSRLSLSYS